MTWQPPAALAAATAQQRNSRSMPAAHARSLLRVALLSRLSLLLLSVASYHLLPSYDHSTALFFPPTCSSPLDRAVISALSPLLRWDALHFLSVARDDYQHEKQHAWFPLLPLTLRATAYPLSAVLNLCPSTALLLAALLLNCAVLVLSVPALYRLTLVLSSSPSLSYLSCVLWLLSPSAVFLLSGGYTELLFACCVFWGLWLCANDRLLLSSCTLCLAACTRSNGALLCMFPLVRCAQLAYEQWHAGPSGPRWRALTQWAATAAISSTLIVVPSLLYSHVSALAYCTPLTVHPGQPLPAYCWSWLPSMYGHVQSTYWHVGLFRYWTLQQLPNFLLAAPVLAISAAAVAWSVRSGRRWWVHGAYLSLLLGVCVVVLHVQVSTRFLSHVPLLYWYMAWSWQRSEKRARWLLGWSVSYAMVGTVLFSLFLPWT